MRDEYGVVLGDVADIEVDVAHGLAASMLRSEVAFMSHANMGSIESRHLSQGYLTASEIRKFAERK